MRTPPKVGDTLNATTTPANAGNVTYAWTALDTATSETGMAIGGNSSSLMIDNNMVGKFIKVTATDSQGNVVSAVTTSAVVENNTASVTLTDKDGLQADGTGVVGDTLRLTYGSALGVPQIIKWYYNDTVVKTTTDKAEDIGTSTLELVTGGDTCKDGNYKVVIVNSQNQTFTSNAIKLVYDELPAEVTGLTLADDYETPTISYSENDNAVVLTATMKKLYDGKFYVYEDGVQNYTNANYTTMLDTETAGFCEASTFDKMTVKNVMDTKFQGKDKAYNTKNALKFVAADGTTTLMWKIRKDTSDKKNTLRRGKSYKLAFDQKNLKTDDIDASGRKDATSIFYYAFEMLYWCGLREGELFALTLRDFDFNKKTVEINKTFTVVKGEPIISLPKTQSGLRTVTIPESLCNEIEGFVKELQVEEDERIFKASKTQLNLKLQKYAEESGVKRIRVHDLRHSHVSLLIHLGFSAVAIGKRVGHKSERITYYYAHLFPGVQKEISERLDQERKI